MQCILFHRGRRKVGSRRSFYLHREDISWIPSPSARRLDPYCTRVSLDDPCRTDMTPGDIRLRSAPRSNRPNSDNGKAASGTRFNDTQQLYEVIVIRVQLGAFRTASKHQACGITQCYLPPACRLAEGKIWALYIAPQSSAAVTHCTILAALSFTHLED